MKYKILQMMVPIVKEYTEPTTIIKTHEDVYHYTKDIANIAQEIVIILLLNAKRHVINRIPISIGTVDQTYLCPRDVFRKAIEDNAKSIIIVHNHPSGDPTPSSDDLGITTRLIQGGKILDIEVLDHVIISNNPTKPFVSIRELCVCQFSL